MKHIWFFTPIVNNIFSQVIVEGVNRLGSRDNTFRFKHILASVVLFFGLAYATVCHATQPPRRVASPPPVASVNEIREATLDSMNRARSAMELATARNSVMQAEFRADMRALKAELRPSQLTQSNRTSSRGIKVSFEPSAFVRPIRRYDVDEGRGNKFLNFMFEELRVTYSHRDLNKGEQAQLVFRLSVGCLINTFLTVLDAGDQSVQMGEHEQFPGAAGWSNSATSREAPRVDLITPSAHMDRQVPLNAPSNQAPFDAASNQEPLDAASNQEPLDAASNQEPLDAASNQEPLDAASNQASSTPSTASLVQPNKLLFTSALSSIVRSTGLALAGDSIAQALTLPVQTQERASSSGASSSVQVEERASSSGASSSVQVEERASTSRERAPGSLSIKKQLTLVTVDDLESIGIILPSQESISMLHLYPDIKALTEEEIKQAGGISDEIRCLARYIEDTCLEQTRSVRRVRIEKIMRDFAPDLFADPLIDCFLDADVDSQQVALELVSAMITRTDIIRRTNLTTVEKESLGLQVHEDYSTRIKCTAVVSVNRSKNDPSVRYAVEPGMPSQCESSFYERSRELARLGLNKPTPHLLRERMWMRSSLRTLSRSKGSAGAGSSGSSSS